jgi:hypothetical protein
LAPALECLLITVVFLVLSRFIIGMLVFGFGFGLGSVLLMITVAMAAVMAIRDSRVFYFLNNKDKRFLYEWF